MTDTIKASVITDHAYKPRSNRQRGNDKSNGDRLPRFLLQPSEHLCKYCRMAEAAHRETTVKR